jgi:hypothetical protein
LLKLKVITPSQTEPECFVSAQVGRLSHVFRF